MRFNKTIEASDYGLSDTFQHIQNMTAILSGAYTPWGTEHRRWEYGIVLEALRQVNAKTVLEVGGGSSMFAASAIWAGFEVTVVDPEDYTAMFEQQVKPGGLLCLTTDFHPSGQVQMGGHLRTYNEISLWQLRSFARTKGFDVFGDAPDYDHFEQNVHGLYTFASLFLQRTVE